MNRLLLLLLAAAALALAGPALADEGGKEHDENPAQTAKALSLQALAILDWGLSHEEAVEKLDLALEADDKRGVDLRAIRAAHDTLHEEQVEAAHSILHEAFPGTPHLVGATFRPASGAAQLAAAIAGIALLGLAAMGLLHRRRCDLRGAPETTREAQGSR